jgi:DNA-binding PadR family transcriptional regulator
MTSMAYGRCGPRGFSRETALEDWLTAMSGPRRHRHQGRPGGFGGPGGPRGHRAARGDVRAAALALLAEEPRNGYQLMQEIEERSGGVWRPSPGAIYPALSQLEDEGLVTATKQGSGRTFELTDEGRAHVEEHKDELAEPWAAVGGGFPKEVLELLGAAAWQVLKAGDAEQRAKASELLDQTRKALYRLLAADDER